jgi:hypothetical protein
MLFGWAVTLADRWVPTDQRDARNGIDKRPPCRTEEKEKITRNQKVRKEASTKEEKKKHGLFAARCLP